MDCCYTAVLVLFRTLVKKVWLIRIAEAVQLVIHFIWTEKWSELQIYPDSRAVANGLTIGQGPRKEQ